MRKTTHQHLAYELYKLNADGLYDGLIRNCLEGFYNDKTSPMPWPKNVLVIHMSEYGGLRQLCDDVIEGYYNEETIKPEEEMSKPNFIMYLMKDLAAEEFILKVAELTV